MVGPNKQFDRDDALNKALQVFWAKGFEATSMQDLVNSMGINRASMYQTYGNKHELFMASLDRYINTNLTQLKQFLEAPGSQLDNLYQLFQYMIEQALQGQMYGCFINNTAVELGPHDPLVAEKIRNFWNRFETLIKKLLKRAIENDELARDTDAGKVAVLLNIHLQGLMAKIKTNAPRKQLEAATELMFEMIREK